jgi:cytochrome c
MKLTLAALFALGLVTTPALAEGDAAAGEKTFNKCKACHMIVAADGTEIVKGGKVGPNLYGVIGRVIGAEPDFKYGDDLAAVGATGLVWDEANFAEYVKDPRGFLRTTLNDDKAKSKMAFKLKDGGEDVAAYLASVAPQG